MYYRNALIDHLLYQQPQPVNMLASAEDGFDPNGPIAQLLRAQRAAEAARQAQAARQMPRAPMPSQGPQTATSVLQQRMRQFGME